MIKTKINNKLLDILKKDELVTLNLKGVIENCNPDIYTNDAMTGLWLKDGFFNYLYTEEESFLNEIIEEVLEELKDSAYIEFSGSHKFVRDYMCKNQTIHWINPCKLLVLEKPEFKKEDLINEIDSLTLDDAEFVNNHYEYKGDYSLDKIRDAIENRPTSCVRIDGKLVSYAVLNLDNSIGYMYTVKEHRKKGYAYEVTKDISLKTIKSGRLPYVQIHHWNNESLNLALKVGYEVCSDVYWIGILNPNGEDLKGDLKKFKDLYTYDPSHISTKLNMSLDFTPLEVTVEDMKDHILASFEGKIFKIKYVYEDEMYFLDLIDSVSNELLRSILIKFLLVEDYVCLLNLSEKFDDTGFRKLKI